MSVVTCERRQVATYRLRARAQQRGARAQQRGARARNRRQEWTRQRFRDTIVREHGRTGIPSVLPHFDYEHEHRFTEHEHDKYV